MTQPTEQPRAGIRPVTYYEAWCAGDSGGEHQLDLGDGSTTAYSKAEHVQWDLEAREAVILPDGRVYCTSHIPADVCPDSANHEHDWDCLPDPEASCNACGADRSYVETPAGAGC
jgi:hypothetical protein